MQLACCCQLPVLLYLVLIHQNNPCWRSAYDVGCFYLGRQLYGSMPYARQGGGYTNSQIGKNICSLTY